MEELSAGYHREGEFSPNQSAQGMTLGHAQSLRELDPGRAVFGTRPAGAVLHGPPSIYDARRFFIGRLSLPGMGGKGMGNVPTALAVLFGVGVGLCSDVHAERRLFSAYDLLAWCESPAEVKRAECIGYLNGVLSGASEAELEKGAGDPKVICFVWPHPNAAQFRPIFIAWVRSRKSVDPDQAMDIANTDAAVGVLQAWRSISSCKAHRP